MLEKGEKDIIWKLLINQESEFTDSHITGLINGLKKDYGEELTEEHYNLCQQILDGDDKILKQALLFLGMYMENGYVQTILNGPFENPELSKAFISNALPLHAYNLLNGKYGGIQQFVTKIRKSYWFL